MTKEIYKFPKLLFEVRTENRNKLDELRNKYTDDQLRDILDKYLKILSMIKSLIFLFKNKHFNYFVKNLNKSNIYKTMSNYVKGKIDFDKLIKEMEEHLSCSYKIEDLLIIDAMKDYTKLLIKIFNNEDITEKDLTSIFKIEIIDKTRLEKFSEDLKNMFNKEAVTN